MTNFRRLMSLLCSLIIIVWICLFFRKAIRADATSASAFQRRRRAPARSFGGLRCPIWINGPARPWWRPVPTVARLAAGLVDAIRLSRFAPTTRWCALFSTTCYPKTALSTSRHRPSTWEISNSISIHEPIQWMLDVETRFMSRFLTCPLYYGLCLL